MMDYSKLQLIEKILLLKEIIKLMAEDSGYDVDEYIEECTKDAKERIKNNSSNVKITKY